jgi:hypothetical protein
VVIELSGVRDQGGKSSAAEQCALFEEAVGQACENAAVRRVARQFGLAASMVRAIDLRYLLRLAEGRRRQRCEMGVDEI